MDGNPIRTGPDGYYIHELDGVEYGSIWSWADAVLAKYGITYDYGFSESFGDAHLLVEQDGTRRDVNCVNVYHWGEWECSVRYDDDVWDHYHQGLIDFALILHSKGIVISLPSVTSSSNSTIWSQYTPAAPDDPAFARQSD